MLRPVFKAPTNMLVNVVSPIKNLSEIKKPFVVSNLPPVTKAESLPAPKGVKAEIRALKAEKQALQAKISKGEVKSEEKTEVCLKPRMVVPALTSEEFIKATRRSLTPAEMTDLVNRQGGTILKNETPAIALERVRMAALSELRGVNVVAVYPPNVPMSVKGYVAGVPTEAKVRATIEAIERRENLGLSGDYEEKDLEDKSETGAVYLGVPTGDIDSKFGMAPIKASKQLARMLKVSSETVDLVRAWQRS